MNHPSELEKLRQYIEAGRWTEKRKCQDACFCTGWCQGKDRESCPPAFGYDPNCDYNKIGDKP